MDPDALATLIELVRRSRDLTARAAELRGGARKALARASLVSQPPFPLGISRP
jgi:hypothetical protein